MPRFPISPAPVITTHEIYWENTWVRFSSYLGLDDNDPNRLLKRWYYIVVDGWGEAGGSWIARVSPRLPISKN
jgi:hypothetical protein